MMVDDSQIVANLMVVICTKLGITNHDEYSLVLEEPENQENIESRNYGTLTLKRKKEEREKKNDKMEQLRKKLHTDDEVLIPHIQTFSGYKFRRRSVFCRN